MTQSVPGAHRGPYTQLTADAARDLRRPIAATEVRFKVQAVRWSRREGPDKVATAAQVVAYVDARTVIARLNLLFPGAWRADTDALPVAMRLTRQGPDGSVTAVRLRDGEPVADDTLYYRCRLRIAGAVFEDVGAGEDPKAAYSDAIKRAAVRAGIGESLYAMDSPWLRVGAADGQLRVTRAGRPYLDERTTGWLARMYAAWLTRAGSIFGAPLAHAPAPALPATDEQRPHPEPGPAPVADAGRARTPLAAVSVPDLPDIPDTPARPDDADGDAEQAAGAPADGLAAVSAAVRETIAVAHAAGVSARTLRRLAVLLAARPADSAIALGDVDDALAGELARRVRQARAAGWEDATLAAMTEQALGSERHATPAQRRDAFCGHLDRLAADALIAPAARAAA
jgi:hypothetical protein